MSLISFNNVDRHFLVKHLEAKLSEAKDTQVTLDFSDTAPLVLKGLLPEILRIIQKHNNVQVIDLSNKNLTDEEAKKIAKISGKDSSITSLVLHHNRILHPKALAEAMEANPKLTIDLTHNKITDHGAFEFTKASVTTGKKVIDLSNNNIGNYGAKIIAEALKDSQTVEELTLVDNKIGMPVDRELAKLPEGIKVTYRKEAVAFCPGLPSLVQTLLYPFTLALSYAITPPTQIREGCVTKL